MPTNPKDRLRMTRLLALVCATNLVAASSIYWTQSMMPAMKAEFGHTTFVELMPGATLIGYAAGVATLALTSRDLTSRNGFATHALLLVAGLVAVAASPNPAAAIAGCLMVGGGCAITQRLMILATTTNERGRRSEVLAMTISSGLLGIVFARAWVGEVALQIGWRNVLAADAVIVTLLTVLMTTLTDDVAPPSTRPEPKRSTSAWGLWRKHPALRSAALQQAVSFAAFNAGWALLPAMAQTTAGTRAGIAGIGAATALVTVRFVRDLRQQTMARTALALLAAAATLAGFASTPTAAMAAMALVEVGTQLGLVANQTRAQAVAEDVGDRGRIASIVTAIGFTGGAAGAAIVNMTA